MIAKRRKGKLFIQIILVYGTFFSKLSSVTFAANNGQSDTAIDHSLDNRAR